MENSKKVLFITGISSGIGFETALVALKKGYHVAGCCRRLEEANQRFRSRGAKQERLLLLQADVTLLSQVTQAIDAVIKTWGRLDGVMANAGFGVMGSVCELEIKDYERQFNTNIWGVLHTVRTSLPHLRKTRGFLGIVGSVNGFLSLAEGSCYGMSKFAVRALAYSLRQEEKQVSITHIAPGFIESEIRKVDNQGHFHAQTPDPVPSWLIMPAHKAGEQILRALEKRKREAIITLHGKLIVWAVSLWPSLFYRLLGLVQLKSRRQPA